MDNREDYASVPYYFLALLTSGQATIMQAPKPQPKQRYSKTVKV